MLDWLKGKVLGLLDEDTIKSSPFHPFTREHREIDPKSLAAKADFYSNDIKKRWMREDFFWHVFPDNDGGDMAMWQGTACAAFVFGGDKRMAGRLLNGMALLQKLGGNDRMARGADLLGVDEPLHLSHNPTKKWEKDMGYIYHQDCSESSLIGQLYGLWSIVYVKPHRELIDLAVLLIHGLAAQIKKDGMRLLDNDGRMARHGDLRPLNWPWQLGHRAPIKLASYVALMALAWKVTGREEFRNEYHELKRKHRGLLSHPETHFRWIHPQYQDMLVYMVYPILITCDEKEQMWKDALLKQWEKNKEEGNSFYYYMTSLVCGGRGLSYAEKARHTLMEFNTDPDLGPTAKSKGHNEPFATDTFRWGDTWWGRKLRGGKEELSYQPIPVWARPSADVHWQRNPYALKGFSDNEYNGMDFLLAYNLGKYQGVLK